MEQRITKRGLHCRFENYDKRVKFREREREKILREKIDLREGLE